LIKNAVLATGVALWAFALLFPVFRLQSVQWSVWGESLPVYYFGIGIPLAAIVLYTWIYHRPRTTVQWAWWLFPFACLPGIMLAPDGRLWALREWTGLFFRGLALGASFACLLESAQARRIASWILLAGIAAGCFGLFELATDKNPLLNDFQDRLASEKVPDVPRSPYLYRTPTGFAGSKSPMGTQGNRLAYMLCIVPFIPLAAWRFQAGGRWRWFYLAALIALLGLTLWAAVVTGWVGLLAGGMAYFLLMARRHPKMLRNGLAGLAGMFVLSLCVPATRSSLSRGLEHCTMDNRDVAHRVASYRVAGVLKEHPLFGAGYGRYPKVYQAYYRGPIPRDDSPDNQFLRWLIENGIVGFAGLLAFLFIVVRDSLRGLAALPPEDQDLYRAAAAGCCSIAAMMMFFDGFGWIGPNMTFWCLLGILSSAAVPRESVR
jgi:hypothetical protein